VVFSPSTIGISEDALPYTWSMIVSIRVGTSNQHICSGTILEDSYILTAAHCLTNLSSQYITIEAGMYYRSESGARIREVDHIYIHPNYTVRSNLYINDIAILHLSLPLDVEDDKNISRTCLPSTTNQLMNMTKYLSNGTRLAISGWDITNRSRFPRSQMLQQAEVYIIDGENSNCSVSDDQHQLQFCAGRYGNDTGNILTLNILLIISFYFVFFQKYVMEVRKSSFYRCFISFFYFLNIGDFGDPIFQWTGYHWIQVGLASYCRMSDSLGVFTRLSTYAGWIESTLNSSIIKPSKIYQCDKNASCGCGQNDVELTISSIIGGENAIEHSWSMIVSVQYGNSHICAGTILSNSFILTSAECIWYFNYDYNITIVAGIHTLSEKVTVSRRIDKVYIHPNYSMVQSNLHDIAIAHLDQPLPLDDIPSIFAKTCVPVNSELPVNEYPEPNSHLVVIGWNYIEYESQMSDMLQQMSIRLLNSEHQLCSSSIIDNNYQFCTGLSNNNKSQRIDYCSGKDD
jgi:secreted trypsin-like serine protease